MTMALLETYMLMGRPFLVPCIHAAETESSRLTLVAVFGEEALQCGHLSVADTHHGIFD